MTRAMPSVVPEHYTAVQQVDSAMTHSVSYEASVNAVVSKLYAA